jgi:hypothetical protein
LWLSVQTILKLPSVEIKWSNRCNGDVVTPTGDQPGEPNNQTKLQSINPNTRSQNLVVKNSKSQG